MNKHLIRSTNKKIIVNTVLEKGTLSRPEIIKLTGLGQTTVHFICKELLNKGVLREHLCAVSQAGRRPRLLRINKQRGFALGIKIDHEGISSAVVNLTSEICGTMTTPWSGDDRNSLSKILINCILTLVEKNDVELRKIVGVGVGIAGIVNSEQGILVKSPSLGLSSVNIGAKLEKRLRVPIFVENDVNVLLAAEKRHGEFHSERNLICLMIGDGVGGGAIIDGKLYSGNPGGAAEFGHMVIAKNGPRCHCGRRGCMAVLASDRFLIRNTRHLIEKKEKASVVDILQAVKRGSVEVTKVYNEAIENLAIGLVNFINIFKPEIVLIGREKIPTETEMLDRLREYVKKYDLSSLHSRVKIRSFSVGEYGWVLGAAELVLGKIFGPPLVFSDTAKGRLVYW